MLILFRGYVVFPDMPSRRKPFTLTEADYVLAQKRLEGVSAPPGLEVSGSTFKRVPGRWHLYAFVTLWTLMDLNFAVGSQPFPLYLKAFVWNSTPSYR